MKKYFVAFLFVLVTSSAANAQYSSSSSWVGVRLGANFGGQSYVLDSSAGNATTGPKFGILGGAQFDHWFSDMWGIGVGLMFDQKGTHESYSPGSLGNQKHILGSEGDSVISYAGNDDYSLSYLEIPIVVKVAFGDGDIKPYVFAGPSIGILLSASNTTSSNGSNVPAPVVPPQISDIKSSLNSTDFSIYFGGGFIDHLYSGPMLVFEAGYALGLTKVYKAVPDSRQHNNPLPHPTDHSNTKSGDIRLSIGMMWQI